MTGSDVIIEAKASFTPDLGKVLFDIFEKYNSSHAGSYYKKPYEIILRKNDEIIGGLTGHSMWDWLYIDYLGIVDKERGNGHAYTLVEMAEKEAVKRNCVGVWLHTMSFQAPNFYKKLGYEVFGQLQDYADGHSRFYFRKYLRDKQ